MRLNKEQVLSIAEMRNRGKTNAEVAEKLGVTQTTIAYWVRRLRQSGKTVKRFPRGGRKRLEI